jgi:hypothetical protein
LHKPVRPQHRLLDVQPCGGFAPFRPATCPYLPLAQTFHSPTIERQQLAQGNHGLSSSEGTGLSISLYPLQLWRCNITCRFKLGKNCITFF